MKTVAFTLRMTPSLRAAIKARAQTVCVSESAWVTWAIHMALPSDELTLMGLYSELVAQAVHEQALKLEEEQKRVDASSGTERLSQVAALSDDGAMGWD